MSLPVEINPHLLGSTGGYEVPNSLKFNSADSAYLSRTLSTSGNRRTWTWSSWIKGMTSGGEIFGAAGSSGGQGALYFTSSSLTLREYAVESGSETFSVITSAVYRDPSAWYHIVAVFDTTQATASDRIKFYVNGVQVTSFSTTNYPGPSFEAYNINNSSKRALIGTQNYSGSGTMNGYQSEINFIDGQALDPSYFGETDATTGLWSPIAYEGTYGTNGFYLNFSDNSDTTSTTLGKDYSGNSNNWTPSGFSVTAGAGNDSVTDSPTNNIATWNPLFFRRNGNKPVFSEGNKKVAGQSTQVSHTGSTIASSGKHYAEFLVTDGSSTITGPGVVRDYWDGGLANSYASNYGGSYYSDNGTRYYNATSDSQTAPGSNRVGIEVDFGGNEVSYYIVQNDGTRTLQGSKLTSANGIDFKGRGIFTATLHDTSSRTVTAFFDSSEWWGTPNAGYEALSTTNLEEPTIKQGNDYFNAKLWSGNGSTQSITGIGFQPDLVWTKDRGALYDHTLFDVLRGATTFLRSNSSSAEETRADSLTSFDSDGFSVGADAVRNNINKSSASYVSWAWKAGGSVAANNNTSGNVTSTVSASTISGFSEVTFTIPSSGTNFSIGHGLGQKPAMIVVKNRGGNNWQVAHKGATNMKDYYITLNGTGGLQNSTGIWAIEPDANVFGISTGIYSNSTNIVAYCWAEIEGYSKFGIYTGNGSADGPFIYLGFRPRYWLIKKASDIDTWAIHDTVRDTYNVSARFLSAESDGAEQTGAGGAYFDFLSNGVKVRTTSNQVNTSSGTYIYAAFAENPFKYSRAR